MVKATSQSADTNSEYQVWYDGSDGVRRSLNALNDADLQQVLTDLKDDEDRRQLLAQSVGLSIPPHEYNIEIMQVTTTVTKVPT